MSRIGIKCAVDGALVTDEMCLACRTGTPRAGRHCDYSYEMLAAMMDSSGRSTAYVSASGTAPVCARQDWLLEREDYHLDPAQGYMAARGTMSHNWLQSTPQPGAIYEQRFQIDVPGFPVPFTGQLDKFWAWSNWESEFYYDWEWEIDDLKSKQDSKLPENEALRANIVQLNCYRYLLKYGSPQKRIDQDAFGTPLGYALVPGVPSNINVTRMKLSYFSMSRPKEIECPILPESEVEAIIRQTMTDRLSHTIIPLKNLDPRKIFRDKETGLAKGFCHNWCPVRGACVRALLDEEE